MAQRQVGVLLFLPVPLVLWLLTAQPLGVTVSLVLAGTLMLSHRFYARPWALSRSGQRCLWCGTSSRLVPLELEEPQGLTRWVACSEDHASRLRATFGWASARPLFLRIGILGSLLLLLVLSFVPLVVSVPWLASTDGPALFRLGVAVTVLPLGWLGPRSSFVSPGRLPFPVHIQALIGTLAVSWLFRLVGLVWLVVGIRHFLLRLA